METLIYLSENYLSPPLDTPLNVQKIQISRSRNEGNVVFFHFEKSIKMAKMCS